MNIQIAKNAVLAGCELKVKTILRSTEEAFTSEIALVWPGRNSSSAGAFTSCLNRVLDFSILLTEIMKHCLIFSLLKNGDDYHLGLDNKSDLSADGLLFNEVHLFSPFSVARWKRVTYGGIYYAKVWHKCEWPWGTCTRLHRSFEVWPRT